MFKPTNIHFLTPTKPIDLIHTRTKLRESARKMYWAYTRIEIDTENAISICSTKNHCKLWKLIIIYAAVTVINHSLNEKNGSTNVRNYKWHVIDCIEVKIFSLVYTQCLSTIERMSARKKRDTLTIACACLCARMSVNVLCVVRCDHTAMTFISLSNSFITNLSQDKSYHLNQMLVIVFFFVWFRYGVYECDCACMFLNDTELEMCIYLSVSSQNCHAIRLMLLK